MRTLLLLFFSFILASFVIKKQANDDYSLTIFYYSFPGRPNIEYVIKNGQMRLRKYRQDVNDTAYMIDEKYFRLNNSDSLDLLIMNTNWNNYQRNFDNKCMDGYAYKIKLVKNLDTLSFLVGCPGDKLLNEIVHKCNSLIPKQKYRERYRMHIR